MANTTRGLYLPELIERKGRRWTVEEVEIRNAAVDTHSAKAFVPRPLTPAQRLARLHEGGHIVYSPSPTRKPEWPEIVSKIMTTVGPRADQRACMKLAKMLEENRIDWLLWDRHKIDLRPAREVLDWAQMPDPDTLLEATGIVLQLAWTVWASRGLGKGIPNEPPARVPDPDTGEYFDKAWKIVADENRDLAHAVIKSCLTMYADPAPATRDRVAAELAEFFLLEEEEEEKQPPVKPEEKQAQEEAAREEEQAEIRKEAEETGHGGEAVTEGGVQYHDHTINIRRPSTRIVRRSIPVSSGVNTRFAHRYMLDKAIFAQRTLTEGGIMIDGSSSMRWSGDDMKVLMDKLPAVTIGAYGEFHGPGGVYGRICTLAKGGRFCKFERMDPGFGTGNDVDVEALRVLAKWPAPRLWLSDGIACGGKYNGPCEHPHHQGYNAGFYGAYGKIMEMCNALMRAHNILRVPDRNVMHKLLRRERVTLYRTCRSGPGELEYRDDRWPADVLPQPVTFTL